MSATDAPDLRSTCWQGLFESAVIASGFPVPERPYQQAHSTIDKTSTQHLPHRPHEHGAKQQQPTPPKEDKIVSQDAAARSQTSFHGLELSFELLMHLAKVEYPLKIRDGYILKGTRTMLVPTLKQEDCLLWHLEVGPAVGFTPEQIYYHIDRKHNKWYRARDTFELRTIARHFLGYCSVAEVTLGGEDIDHGRIRRSTATDQPARYLLDRAGLNIGVTAAPQGFGLTASAPLSFKLAANVRLTSSKAEVGFSQRLLTASEQPLLLYDTGVHCGYLVPELSVLLHCLQTWAHRQGKAGIPFARASSDGGRAALSAIDSRWDTVIDETAGSKINVRDKVKEFMSLFMKAKEEQCIYERENPSVTHRHQHHGKKNIYGWDYMDLIHFAAFSCLKEAEVGKGQQWPCLFNHDPAILTVFGEGLNQALRPASAAGLCQACTSVPPGQGLLLASNRCILQYDAFHAYFQKRHPYSSCLCSALRHDPYEACSAAAVEGGLTSRTMPFLRPFARAVRKVGRKGGYGCPVPAHALYVRQLQNNLDGASLIGNFVPRNVLGRCYVERENGGAEQDNLTRVAHNQGQDHPLNGNRAGVGINCSSRQDSASDYHSIPDDEN
ncbi:MAG: hypothetical protein Q9162_001981 [Coniocarpon cinnabarinum]